MPIYPNTENIQKTISVILGKSNDQFYEKRFSV